MYRRSELPDSLAELALARAEHRDLDVTAGDRLRAAAGARTPKQQLAFRFHCAIATLLGVLDVRPGDIAALTATGLLIHAAADWPNTPGRQRSGRRVLDEADDD